MRQIRACSSCKNILMDYRRCIMCGEYFCPKCFRPHVSKCDTFIDMDILVADFAKEYQEYLARLRARRNRE